jgi:integrase/recombinase XerD
MDRAETIRLSELYERHLRLLKLQGKSQKTMDAYARAVRRISQHLDCCPDQLTLEQREKYFADLVESHSWSTVKIDSIGLQFFWKYVLERDWDWVNIVKAPKIRSLPDILTTTEVEQLIGATRNLRYRVFLLTTYSMGLRLSETLALQVGDIDGERKSVHIRRGKGHKDRFVPLPDLTYQALRALWCKHRNPCRLFPNAVGSPERIRTATTHMDRGGPQAAMKAVVDQCGIKKSLGPFPAPQLCNSPARKGLKPSPYPGTAGSQQRHHHCTLRSFDRHPRTEFMGYH